jgi:hypothetical protein
VHLAFFVCPPVDYRLLRGHRPEQYLRDHWHGSVLSRHTRRLRQLFQQLEAAQVRVAAWAILADTDEVDYLWSGVQQPCPIDAQSLEARWVCLAGALTTYLTEEIPGARESHPRVARPVVVRVTRLSCITPSAQALALRASVIADPFRYFTGEDIAQETAIMRDLWRPGAYYEGLPEPGHTDMMTILRHKFAAYAMQGALLRQIDPNLVLIQTERPPLLRKRMLEVGWSHSGGGPLPAVQLFASDDMPRDSYSG